MFPKKQKGVCSQSNGGLDSTQTITTFKLQWIINVGESEFVERVSFCFCKVAVQALSHASQGTNALF